MNSSGIAMGSNFSVDASGNVTMAGTVTAAAGEIGGFEIEPKALKKSVFTDGQVTASVVLSPDTGSHNSLLFRMNAERNNGNATIYEIVNTIKLVLIKKE